MDRKKIDPALRAALDAAAQQNDTVEAVVVLNPTDSSKGVDSPEETIRRGKALVKRVRDTVGYGPDQVNVFEHLQSLAIRAQPRFIEHLLEQPEVDAAMANGSPARRK